MALTEPLLFKGVPGSLYTRKMLAYLRYRHIRYQLLLGSNGQGQVDAVFANTGCDRLISR